MSEENSNKDIPADVESEKVVENTTETIAQEDSSPVNSSVDTSNEDKHQSEDENTHKSIDGKEENSEVTQESKQEEVQQSNEKKEDKQSTENEEKKEEPVEMIEIPKKRLEELETVEARALEEIKRERAESINFRKRIEKQRDEFAEIASTRVLTKVLNIKDDLDRIVENGKDEIPETHLTGLQMLQQRIDTIFSQEGVELIKIEVGKTKYDPIYHEAIVSQPIENVAPNTIINLVSAGFVKKDRVLRAAKVIIAKEIEKAEPKEEEKKEIQEEVEFTEF